MVRGPECPNTGVGKAMSTEEQVRQIDAVLALLRKDKVLEANVKKTKRLMRDWSEDMDVMKASPYEP